MIWGNGDLMPRNALNRRPPTLRTILMPNPHDRQLARSVFPSCYRAALARQSDQLSAKRLNSRTLVVTKRHGTEFSRGCLPRSGRGRPDSDIGGDGEIRTRGSDYSLRRFSKPLVSATHPRLRLVANCAYSGRVPCIQLPILSNKLAQNRLASACRSLRGQGERG